MNDYSGSSSPRAPLSRLPGASGTVLACYRRYRRRTLVGIAGVVIYALVAVLSAPVTRGGALGQLLVSTLALTALGFALSRRYPAPALDSGTLIACSAPFTVAFALTEGVTAIGCAVAALCTILAETALLVISAESVAEAAAATRRNRHRS